MRLTEYLGEGDFNSRFFKGKLLNEPYEDNGVHCGEELTFFVCNLVGEVLPSAICHNKKAGSCEESACFF